MNTRTDNARMILLAPLYVLAILAGMLWWTTASLCGLT